MTTHIYLKALILHRQESTLTVQLEDGFAQAQAVVHQDYALPLDSRIAALVAALIDEHPAYKDRLHKTVAHRCTTCLAINGAAGA